MQKTDIPNLDALTWPDLDFPDVDFSALELELDALTWPDLDWTDLAWTAAVSLAATRGPGWCCIPLSDIGGS